MSTEDEIKKLKDEAHWVSFQADAKDMADVLDLVLALNSSKVSIGIIALCICLGRAVNRMEKSARKPSKL